MPMIIPVNSTGDRRIQVLLGTNLLTVRTYWNSTIRGWFMDLTDASGITFASDLALVPIVNALDSSLTLTRLYGQFRIFMTDDGENDTETSLGETAVLWWFAPGEWEANEIPLVASSELPFDVATMYSEPPPTPPSLFLDGSWRLDGTYYLNGKAVPAQEVTP